MRTIAVDQAVEQVRELLSRAAHGEEFTIIDRGTPIARVLPPGPLRQSTDQAAAIEKPQESGEGSSPHPPQAVAEAIDRIRKLRKGNRLGSDLTIRQLIDEGRRF